MNKTSKVCVAATLALGTLIGVTVVENSAPTSKQAQAAITPYYTYMVILVIMLILFWIRILLTRLSMIM